MNWRPIETLPKLPYQPFKMFVVIGVNVLTNSGVRYTTDPYCVWRDVNGKFARWPHSFEPTHWCPLPNYNPHTFSDTLQEVPNY